MTTAGFDPLPSVGSVVSHTDGVVRFDPDEPKRHAFAARRLHRGYLRRLLGREGAP